MLTAGQTTIGTIRATAQLESDMVNNPVVLAPEWNQYINTARFQLYGILIQKFGQNYAQKFLEFNTDGTTSRYPLPADTFKVSKVDVQLLGYPAAWWCAAQRVELSVIQRYDVPAGLSQWTNQVFYALMGDYGQQTQSIWLAPLQGTARPIRIIYVPRLQQVTDRGSVRLSGVVATDSFTFTITGIGAVTLTAGTDFAVGATDVATAVNLANAFNVASPANFGDMFRASASGTVVTVAQVESAAAEVAVVTWGQTGDHMRLSPALGWSNLIDGVNGWEEFCVVDPAMKALGKQYRDTGEFVRRRAEILKLIEDEAANRDAGAPVTGADTLGLDSGGFDSASGFGFGAGGGGIAF